MNADMSTGRTNVNTSDRPNITTQKSIQPEKGGAKAPGLQTPKPKGY